MTPLRDKELRGIRVYTKGGDHVGKIAGIVVDADSHRVEQYVISKSRLFSVLLPDDLLVHREQVIELTPERMVIEDAVVAERVAEAVLPKHAAQAFDTGAAAHSAQAE